MKAREILEYLGNCGSGVDVNLTATVNLESIPYWWFCWQFEKSLKRVRPHRITLSHFPDVYESSELLAFIRLLSGASARMFVLDLSGKSKEASIRLSRDFLDAFVLANFRPVVDVICDFTFQQEVQEIFTPKRFSSTGRLAISSSSPVFIRPTPRRLGVGEVTMTISERLRLEEACFGSSRFGWHRSSRDEADRVAGELPSGKPVVPRGTKKE